jgi:hypothetical protein
MLSGKGYTFPMTKHKSNEATKSYLLKIPVSLHKKLTELAVKERRSLADQIIYLLENSLQKSDSH